MGGANARVLVHSEDGPIRTSELSALTSSLDAVPVSSWVPLLIFTILFGLSMDYEVFLLSRVITGAGAIMVAVFLGYAMDPNITVKTIGVGLAIAVLLDVTVVRMMLVPAAMALLGKWNWWIPRWLDRALPRLDIDAPAPERQPALVEV